jgi:ATP-binding cassette, subfamily B, bacterial
LATANEVAREVLETRAEARGTLSLRRRTLRHVFGMGMTGQHRFGAGDILSRTLESTQVTATGTSVLVSLLTSLVTAVGGLVALFLIDLWLGLLFVAGAPLMWWLTRWLIRRIGLMTSEYQRLHSELSTRFVDAIRGARTIRASGTAGREIDRVLTPLPELGAAGKDFWAAQRKAMWQTGLLLPTLQIGALIVAGYGVLHGRVSPGELLAAQAYLGNAMGLLKQTAILARFARARGSAQRVHDMLATEPPRSGTRTLPRGRGRLSLRDVHVSKDGHPVLGGLTLDVPAGCSVAIVGASGAGKSTLTEVAGGLLTPDSGTVSLDGVPLTQLRPDVMRRAVTYAFERPKLLGDTVADAIAYSDNPPDDRRVEYALRVGAAASFVHRLPRGINTPLADLRLSGGELQRLGLARAAARNARLVVLDDATSSVDTATETEITGALETALRGTTRLIVAHRMSTAARADLVAWLHNGVVRALAPHEQLLRDPAYLGVFQPKRAGVRDTAKERLRDPELTMQLDRVEPSVGDPERTLELRMPAWLPA